MLADPVRMLRRTLPETSVTNHQLSRRRTPEKFNLHVDCSAFTSVNSCLLLFPSHVAVHPVARCCTPAAARLKATYRRQLLLRRSWSYSHGVIRSG